MTVSNNVQRRFAVNDLVKNRGVNIALTVVLVLSSFLMATGAMVMERMVGSIDELFSQAKPPHFLQMHVGDYDEGALEQFAAEHPEIESWLILEMLAFDGAAITWENAESGVRGTLADSFIDNLFVTQNEEFDFLLDGGGEIPRPAAGEVYVPVAYQQDYELNVGDDLEVQTHEGVLDLKIAGFVRDAQMASSLSSSTRFLVSEEDFSNLGQAGGGEPEIIVEYRLGDPSQVSGLQTAYEAHPDLPRNGQAVTFEMIRIINAFSDGLVAIALVFISLLFMVIAFVSLRFVIRGNLEDEVRQIGAMKAIGVPSRAISGLFITKYKLMTLVACVAGGLLAIAATAALSRGIEANYAAARWQLSTVLVPLIALLVVYLVVILMCRSILRSVNRIEVVNAMVHGSTLSERQSRRRTQREAYPARGRKLSRSGSQSVNQSLMAIDLRAEAGQWLLIPMVFFLSAVAMTIPMNLLTTFESPRFATYMGVPEGDLRADIQFSGGVDEQRRALLAEMEGDERVADVRDYGRMLMTTEGDEGPEALRAEVGDFTDTTMQFVRGQAPREGEIALSVLNADKLNVGPGDQLEVNRQGQESTLTVSGVYQDVTSGGYTARLAGPVPDDAMGYVIYADLADSADPTEVAAAYSERHDAAEIIPTREYVTQTLSYVTNAFRTAALLALALGVGVAALIVCLFLKLRIVRDRQKMGVMATIGFSASEIIGQLRVKTLIVTVLGTLAGLLFAATAGEALVGGLISVSGIGISSLSFIPLIPVVYGVYPVLLIAAGYLGAVLLTRGIRRADKSSWLKG